jgi:Mg2+ and Co2+ transporter CorA
MQNLKRNKNITFRVTDEEYEMVKKRMAQTHITNLRAYLLKQAIDGQVINIEMESIQECSRLLSSIANNVNQLARKANSGGNVYTNDLRDVQRSLDRVFEQQDVITAKLAKIIDNI